MWPQQQTSQNPLGGFGSRIDLSRIGRFAGGAAGGTALFRGAPDARDAGEPTAPAVAGGARPAGEAEFYGFKPPHGDARAETAATAPARWPPAGGGGGGAATHQRGDLSSGARAHAPRRRCPSLPRRRP